MKTKTAAIGVDSESDESLPVSVTMMSLLDDFGVGLLNVRERDPLHLNNLLMGANNQKSAARTKKHPFSH